VNTLPIRTWLAFLSIILGLASALVGGALVYESSDSAVGAVLGAVLIGLAGATPPWVASVVIALLAEQSEALRRIEFASRAGSPEDTIG
jgi:hypothetical protein